MKPTHAGVSSPSTVPSRSDTGAWPAVSGLISTSNPSMASASRTEWAWARIRAVSIESGVRRAAAPSMMAASPGVTSSHAGVPISER